MPNRPASPCAVPGCPHRKPCPRHPQRATWNVKANRGSTKQRGYSGKHASWWRLTVLANHPQCPCGAVATVADHIVPIAEGGDPLDLRNGDGLCRSCHAKKTQREALRRR